jgi:hypothetical protein
MRCIPPGGTSEKLLPVPPDYGHKCSKWSQKFRQKVFPVYEKNTVSNSGDKTLFSNFFVVKIIYIKEFYS